ncbi:MAG: hypothetical protein HFH62_04565 [Lachnospiraceae bacterium]|nr:hypothetical protein [Lachnospiraceae bacterium]
MGKYESFSFGLTLDSNAEDVAGRLGNLSRKAGLVMSRAINRTTGHVKTRMKEEAVKRYHVKAGKVSRTISVPKKATMGSPSARILSIGQHPNLISFDVSPKRAVRTLKSGKRSPKVYLASVKRDSGRKPLAGANKPFIVEPRRGGIAVFCRLSGSEKSRSNTRSGIIGVGGPAIPQMIKNKDILGKVSEDANEMMAKRLDHEIEQVLK